MLGLELTLTDDILIGLVLVLLKTFFKPSKFEGQIILALIPLLIRVIRRSHKEHIHFIDPISRQIKILKGKIKGDKLTLG